MLVDKEHARKNYKYAPTSNHRDGQDVLNFLLDLINAEAGYAAKHYDES